MSLSCSAKSIAPSSGWDIYFAHTFASFHFHQHLSHGKVPDILCDLDWTGWCQTNHLVDAAHVSRVVQVSKAMSLQKSVDQFLAEHFRFCHVCHAVEEPLNDGSEVQKRLLEPEREAENPGN